jgi:glycosyltransferase involved in cell wall biosynthesis
MTDARKPLRIAYFTVNDPLDKRSWSGITYYLGQSLQRNIGEVDFLGPVPIPRWLDKTLRAVAKAHRVLFKREFYTKYSLLLNFYAARYLARQMRGKHYDMICAPASSPALAFFRGALPVIHIHDATFRCLSGAYMEFSRASPLTHWTGNYLERRALAKSDFIVYSSHWAANSALNDYGVPPERMLVRPLGANMDHVPPASLIFDKEQTPVLSLLYLAVEWERKGGIIAYETLLHLRALGIPARLIVCGCTPPASIAHPDMEVIPFLNKNLAADHERFVGLLSTVHFLLLPTRADCSLLVACESNAYGVPAITTHVGGVPDVVTDGVNGYCLPYDARGDVYGALIASIHADKPRYHALIRSSRERYEQTLNWDRWAEDFKRVYPQVLKAHGARV